jgi:hypothetical protein
MEMFLLREKFQGVEHGVIDTPDERDTDDGPVEGKFRCGHDRIFLILAEKM